MKDFFQTAADIHALHLARATRALRDGDLKSFNLHAKICRVVADSLDSIDPSCILHDLAEQPPPERDSR